MAGSIRKLGPDRYQLRVYVGVDPATGKKRQLGRVYRGSREGAKRALLELALEVADGKHDPEPPPSEDDPTVGEWVEAWFTRSSPSWSPSSIATARSHIQHHITPGLGDRRLVELRRRHVEQWLHYHVEDIAFTSA